MSFIMCSHVLSLLTARHRPHFPRYANPRRVYHSKGPGLSRRRLGRTGGSWRGTHERTRASVSFSLSHPARNPIPRGAFTPTSAATAISLPSLSPRALRPRRGDVCGCCGAGTLPAPLPIMTYLLILSYLAFRSLYHSRPTRLEIRSPPSRCKRTTRMRNDVPLSAFTYPPTLASGFMHCRRRISARRRTRRRRTRCVVTHLIIPIPIP
jgi:hypothetical protein